MGPALEEVVLQNSHHSLVINEVMLLLAEKRTSLSALNAGMAVVAVPLSILTFLVATSRFYETLMVMHILAPLWAACAVLFALGMYIIVRAVLRIRRYDARIAEIKEKDAEVRELIEVE